MKALRFLAGHLALRDIAPPEREDEALVRVLLAGICSTDLHITRGYAGHQGTLGHEFVGIVESSPDRSQVGARVVGEINAGCGVCTLCQGGDSRHCESRTVLGIHGRDGAFAEYLSLPARNLLTIPAHVSDREAVFAEPLAAACQILEQVFIDTGSRVALIGDGKLAQLIARVLTRIRCNLVLLGKHKKKMELASQAGIATAAATSASAATLGRFDYVVEASGSESGLQLALDLVRPLGTIILKSTFHGPVSLEAWRIVVDEINVLGSRCGRLEKAIEILGERSINFADLIADEFALDDGLRAFEVASTPGTLKVLLRP